jgi:hypothetical protein
LTVSSIKAQFLGGSGSGYTINKLSATTCPYTIDYSLLVYFGGNGAGYDSTLLNKSNCAFNINPEFLIYAGGNGAGYDSAQIKKTTCPIVVNSEFLIYSGGNGAGYDSAQISKTSCPAPENYNFYFGSPITVGTSSNKIINNTTNQTGPYISASASNLLALKGDCISLTTTGSGATTYTWTQSVGTDLVNASLQNASAKPTQRTVYTVTAVGATAGCRDKSSVTVDIIDIGTTSIAYPASICNSQSSNQYQYPTLTGMNNGVYSISPSTGMTIDTKSGAIKTYSATAQTYVITYTYGSTCTSTTTSTVVVTNNCALNVGVVDYKNMYVGGSSASVASGITLTANACAENSIIESKIYAGGLSNNIASVTKLNAQTCTINTDVTTLIYAGGISDKLVTNKLLAQQACLVPVSDNFYLGGTGMGYNLATKTPTSGSVTGTSVAVSANQTVCPGTPVTITATGATNFTWSPATYLSSTIVGSPVVTPMTTTTYTVVGTGGVGCINTAKVTVSVIEDNYTRVSYGAYNFDETDMGVKKVNYILGPLSGSFSASPSGLFYDQATGSFTPGLSTSGLYAISYNYRKGACNYSYVSNINITTLPPSISYPAPSLFYINYSGISVSPTNVGGRAVKYEALDALPNGLIINDTTGVITGTPTALVDNAAVRVRAYNYNKSGGINYSDVYTMNISVKKPTISSTSTGVASMNTTYGLGSTTQTVNVSGQNIILNIVVTAPTGFEISTSPTTGFVKTLVLMQSGGNVNSKDIYVRLGGTSAVGNFSGNLLLKSEAADDLSLPISTSYVAPASLTITTKYFQKFFGSKINLGAGSKYFNSTGLMNNETIGSVTLIAVGGTEKNDTPGMYLATPSLATGGTFSSSNYNITYTPGQFEVLYSLYNFQLAGNTSNWVGGKVPIPTFSNISISNLLYNSATYSSYISPSFVNIDQRGVCYSTSPDPTLQNNVIIDTGYSSGSLSINLANLTQQTTYYIRTFVTIGNKTIYSNSYKFKTPKKPVSSILLSSSSQYLSFSKIANMDAAGDFTFETWIKFNTIAAGTMDPIFAGGQYDYFAIYGAVATRINANGVCSGDKNLAPTSSISTGAWHHIAMVRSNNIITFYLDGLATGTTATCNGVFLSTLSTMYIGKNVWRSGNLNAYITNMRYVVGTAVYTSNFTPPTSLLTSIPGTQFLLTVDDDTNPFKDSSPNSITVTAAGSPTITHTGGPF